MKQDFRFAIRMIWKNPWFSAAIVATLALGMGVNTTVFSLVNAVLYKPLPFPGGERLVMVDSNNLAEGQEAGPVSYPDYRDFKQAAGAFERLELLNPQQITLAERGNPPERYRGARVSAGMFDMLSTRPVIGRGFRASDEQAGAPPVLLIGYTVWRDRYGKDPAVIGRAVRANERPATIVGVMPEGFKFPSHQEAWMAAAPEASDENRGNRAWQLVGMLKEGVSMAAAHADLSVIAARLESRHPATNKGRGVNIRTFHQAMNGGPIRLVFLLMLGAVGFVLLIACANVANMLLSRAVERRREISIRAAMGAGRWRVIRQLLMESVLLSVLGGLLGLGLAQLGVNAFALAVADVGKPYWIEFSMDYVVFAYFGALTVLSGILFGIAPALSASRVNLVETLKDGARGSGGARGGYLSSALVVLQFALAVVLLSGAGLMMRSFMAAQNEFAGMNAAQVLATRVSLPASGYGKPEERQRFFERLLPKLSSIPGARMVAAASNLPGSGAAGWHFQMEGKPVEEEQRRPAVRAVVATRDYLPVLGLSLLRGRDFEETDGMPGREAVIVSHSFASRFFPSQDPIGRRIRLFRREDQPREWMTIVGIAPDFRQQSPGDAARDPLILLPYRFESAVSMAVLIRASGSPSALTPVVRAEVQQIDPDLPLSDTMPLQEHFHRQRWYLRVFGTVFLVFAVIALGMAAVGIYAVMANAASRRTREIGVRMALGAGASSITGLVLRRGAVQLGIGVVLGLGAALAVCRLMASLLFNISPSDPITFAAVTLTLSATGLAATWIPARRAAALNPVEALRCD